MIAVTGASGHLGCLIIGKLLDRDVPAGGVIAGNTYTEGDDLLRLIGRPTNTLTQAVASAVWD